MHSNLLKGTGDLLVDVPTMSSTTEVKAVEAGGDVFRVGECTDRRAWDEYVGRDGSGLFHRWNWNDVFAVYRLPVYRLAAYRGDRIVGVLPVVEQRSRLFKHQLVSLPWFDAAGVLADDEPESRALVEAVVQLSEAKSAELVQLRQIEEHGLSPHYRVDKLLMRLGLPADSEELWNGLKAKVRNQVRKGEKSGLDVVCGGEELLAPFYDVYSHNMRDLASPAHSRAFFEALCSAFPSEVQIWNVRLGQETIGAGLTMANGSCLEIPWASSLRKYNHLCVNHAMYWKILEHACQSGFSWFHFGRSSVGSGTYKFKQQWGAEGLPLYWYFLGDAGTVAEEIDDPAERFGLAREIWSHLPVSVSRRLGPWLISKLA